MLACARRISGIHALSGLDKDIEFTRNYNSCNLSFLPEFRAKNQDSLSESQHIEIKSISNIVGQDELDDEMVNCPVRMLRQYLARTDSHRLGKRRLFISLNKAYEKDVSKNTLALWIGNLLRDAYQDANHSVPKGASRTHEIRKVSASLAHASNISMANIMRAAYWRSDNTFTSYYLRDIRVKRRNETFGISKVVVAGAAVNL